MLVLLHGDDSDDGDNDNDNGDDGYEGDNDDSYRGDGDRDGGVDDEGKGFEDDADGDDMWMAMVGAMATSWSTCCLFHLCACTLVFAMRSSHLEMLVAQRISPLRSLPCNAFPSNSRPRTPVPEPLVMGTTFTVHPRCKTLNPKPNY